MTCFILLRILDFFNEVNQNKLEVSATPNALPVKTNAIILFVTLSATNTRRHLTVHAMGKRL